MKYAIVEISGRQFWIETGKHYDFNRIPTELGKEITLNRVLLINNEGELLIGKPYLEKVDKNLTAQNYNKEEKLNVIIKKTIQENLVSKHLIKELIKEVERLTLTNKIFKNKIIENETRNFKNKIFEIDYIEINKIFLIGFLLVMVFASYGFLIFIAAAYKKIIFKLAN